MPKQARPESQEFHHDSGDSLLFGLVRSARKTLGLYVYRDGSVLVRAPLRAKMADIFIFLQQRWAWLQEKREQFADEPAPVPLAYADGLRFLHLGQRYALRLQPSTRTQISLEGEELVVRMPPLVLESQEEIEQAIRRWQRREALRVFPLRLAFCHEAMRELQLPFPALSVRRMRSRWGSCSSKGAITLNLELIRMPPACIDYVIIHELCHLQEFHHGPAFYALQARFLPDWAERKALLNGLARQQYLQAALLSPEEVD